MALGLPIKIVVLTIVGIAGLTAMLVIISDSESAIPKAMHADLKSNNLVILSKINNDTDIELPVQVVKSDDGTPVERAKVVLSGLDAVAANTTDSNGTSILIFNKTDFQLDADEGYLKLSVSGRGFQDYSNEYAVKIVR